MGREAKSLVLVAMLAAMGSVAAGQESLKDIVEQEGFAWMVGQWKATTDEGQDIVLTYRWAVKGHAIVTSFKMGETSSQGMIYFDADEQQVRQFSIDSRGRATKAAWEVQEGKAISKTKMTDEYGQTTDIAIAYAKISVTTMKVAVYGLEDGQLSDYPWFEIDFKKEN
ncbi:MAG: hypothetical protein ACYTAS_04125 [Planctomycetota bacterium]|jgi:hypothetical protein